jgi:hypothetical protein
MKKTLLILFTAVTLVGCTDNERVRYWGGKATTNLPSGQKLVTVTWKEKDLWILTKTMTTNDVAETYTFKESSNLGLIEGTVVIVEKK